MTGRSGRCGGEEERERERATATSALTLINQWRPVGPQSNNNYRHGDAYSGNALIISLTEHHTTLFTMEYIVFIYVAK